MHEPDTHSSNSSVSNHQEKSSNNSSIVRKRNKKNMKRSNDSSKLTEDLQFKTILDNLVLENVKYPSLKDTLLVSIIFLPKTLYHWRVSSQEKQRLRDKQFKEQLAEEMKHEVKLEEERRQLKKAREIEIAKMKEVCYVV